MRALVLLTLILGAIAGLGCGGEPEPADGAVEAREGNVASFGGVEYRVTMFRQINARIAPDRALYDGPLPGAGEGLFAAFIVACNRTDGEQIPTDEIHLEDAFGEVFKPVDLQTDNAFAYRPRPLDPDECLPGEDSAAARTVSGAVLIFRVPLDALSERPMILALDSADAGNRGARVELDL